MSRTNRSRLETLLNLALIVVAVAFAVSLIARYAKRDTPKPAVEARASVDSIDSSALREALRKKEPLVVLNIDDREIYKQEHIDGAINIPFDELETRILDELKPTDKIVIYEHGQARFGNAAFDILKRNGFSQVVILRGGFRNWQESATTTTDR